MFKVLILVCSVSLAPQDCQIDSAAAVINGPDAASERLCGLNGQAYLAGTSLATHRADEYVKVKCSRMSVGRTVG
ncbi:MAG: hypothetical protein Kow00114_21660 [Kiloniellaceae bacterium]